MGQLGLGFRGFGMVLHGQQHRRRLAGLGVAIQAVALQLAVQAGAVLADVGQGRQLGFAVAGGGLHRRAHAPVVVRLEQVEQIGARPFAGAVAVGGAGAGIGSQHAQGRAVAHDERRGGALERDAAPVAVDGVEPGFHGRSPCFPCLFPGLGRGSELLN